MDEKRELRDQPYMLRLTKSERGDFDKAAADLGLSLADWLRQAGREKAAKQKKKEG
jgi:hypothetical protein